MAFVNVGVITPRANVSQCRCIPGMGCACTNTRTNNIGVPPHVYPTIIAMPGETGIPGITGMPGTIGTTGITGFPGTTGIMGM